MTLFEYITIANSLILSFGVSRLLGGIPELFRADKPYWLHLLWVFGLLVNYPLMFWQMWNYRMVEDWQFFSFLLVLATPAACLLTANFLIPTKPEKESNWEQYYFNNRSGIFGNLAIASMFTLLSTFLLLDVEADNPSRILGAGSIVFLLILAYSGSKRVHVGITIGMGVVATLMFLAYRLPGALT
ncbi:MAG: hypothetical protein ACI9VI_001384 [Candidatus Azotimanducaceae bacterium]|jgi:hypothetical protein